VREIFSITDPACSLLLTAESAGRGYR